ncbi:polysaccharide biosynthesis/export family protein [Fischerella sp. JS2]|uniref:polysaccharide biosynthesis/export family protein n=1 Tax=Fischerella sp. JS2 TaxID=2597771 RepID=UPI0028E1E049|nr:polysaccharide biosynthesis/export family protein [Fischerella sp. JS2]
MRAFSTLYLFSFQVSIFLATPTIPIVAQAPPPASATHIEFTQLDVSSNEILPQLNRYILGPGDIITLQVQRPPGSYRLGPGDVISVAIERFPDLGFQASVNPEGKITVPLLGTVSLQNLTLAEAQNKIRSLFNTYVIDPIVTLSLVSQRPELNLSLAINPEGNVVLPQVGTVSLKGLSLEEAQEKIRLLLDRVTPGQVVAVSLASPRTVQITISGEVPRPGIYPISSPTPRIADALLLAGGSTMMADLRQVQLRRKLIDGSIITQNLDLYSPLLNGEGAPNIRLQDGDAIVVMRRDLASDDNYDRNLVARSSLAQPQIRVRVLNYATGGLVTQTLPNGSNFVDVLSGVNPNFTNIRDIALVRFDPERGKAITQRLNGKKALAGDATQNVPLQDNDVIVIGRNLIGKITNLINTFTQPFFSIQNFLNFFETFGSSSGGK